MDVLLLIPALQLWATYLQPPPPHHQPSVLLGSRQQLLYFTFKHSLSLDESKWPHPGSEWALSYQNCPDGHYHMDKFNIFYFQFVILELLGSKVLVHLVASLTVSWLRTNITNHQQHPTVTFIIKLSLMPSSFLLKIKKTTTCSFLIPRQRIVTLTAASVQNRPEENSSLTDESL